MRKGKIIVAIVLAAAILCLVFGGGQTEGVEQENHSAAQPPEGYVYDYQVSLEPIPKEIADLGGPCQGTVHAFPSRIEIELAQKMMEEDPVLKARVEKRIPEIEAYLKETIGGEFRVDGITDPTDINWICYCTELDTENQFTVRYLNTEHTEDDELSEYNMFIYEYYEKKDSEELQEDFSRIVQDSFGDCLNTIWAQERIQEVDVYITLFTDTEVNKLKEQHKVLSLWGDLKAYNDEMDYNISVSYWPTEYREVMEQKYLYGNLYDLGTGNSVKLMENGELAAEFWYATWSANEDADMDKLYLWYKVCMFPMFWVWSYYWD